MLARLVNLVSVSVLDRTSWRVIFMERTISEIVESRKRQRLLTTSGVPCLLRRTPKTAGELLEVRERAPTKWKLGGAAILRVPYCDVLAQPSRTLSTVLDFVQPAILYQMSSIIRPTKRVG